MHTSANLNVHVTPMPCVLSQELFELSLVLDVLLTWYLPTMSGCWFSRESCDHGGCGQVR